MKKLRKIIKNIFMGSLDKPETCEKKLGKEVDQLQLLMMSENTFEKHQKFADKYAAKKQISSRYII